MYVCNLVHVAMITIRRTIVELQHILGRKFGEFINSYFISIRGLFMVMYNQLNRNNVMNKQYRSLSYHGQNQCKACENLQLIQHSDKDRVVDKHSK